MVEATFWISCGLILYIYIGYGLLIYILAKFFPNPIKKGNFNPRVSVIIVAHNEEANIRKKIANILSQKYPQDLLELLVVSDGSTDKTVEIIKECAADNLRLVVIKERIGKAEALNQAVTLCGAEFLVLTDSRQLLSPDAIKELVCNFADEGVGVVSGELEFSDETNTVTAKGLDFYWEYEKLLRKSESKFGSCCGATGAIYAIRKNLFKPIAPDTLLDDVLIPLNIIRQGYRCVFEPAAKAFDAVAQVSSEEARRKVRTIAGNFQLFFRFPQLLAPFNNKMWLAAFSHKFLRLISPLCLLAALLSNLFLLKSLFFKFIFLGQIIFYFFAGAGYLLQRFGQKGKFFSIPYTFIFLNFITVKAFFAYLRFRPQQIWRVKNA